MDDGGEGLDIAADMLKKSFSRRIFSEKLEIVKQGRPTPQLAALTQPGKGFVRHFHPATTRGIVGWQCQVVIVICIAGNACYLQRIDVLFGATVGFPTWVVLQSRHWDTKVRRATCMQQSCWRRSETPEWISTQWARRETELHNEIALWLICKAYINIILV